MDTRAPLPLVQPSGLALLIFLLLPVAALAAPPELLGISTRLEAASSSLAGEARRVGAAGNVVASAEKLAVKAGQLEDTLRRGRSSASLQLRFADVSRYFQRLGEALGRLDHRAAEVIYPRYSQVAALYGQLDLALYGNREGVGVPYGPQLFLIVPPAAVGRYVRNPDLGLSPQHPQAPAPVEGARLRANQGYYRLGQ